ncbi:polysaccharide chain length determinant protein, PEP-CTERM locus subfamily [Thiorhodovibrio winogradskyi]|uniref:Polysaccharide chain length determinant protein, PEP-CTERM locus subfamily n=2 Tax=Thiorhodovibrio winogradskyi TaxID=77007 RepID=A0ABZ0SCF5_9GAMM
MSKVLLSRPNLEKAIRMSDFELGIKNDDEKENLIALLNNKIRISGDRNAPIYTISFEYLDPDSATRLVQALVSIFIEEALAGDQTATTTARDFLDEEIADYEKRLRESELRLADFKRDNAGMLPGETGYYATLEQARDALKDANLSLEEATKRRDRLREEIEAENDRADASGGTSIDQNVTDPRITEMQEKLDNLLLRFTERHPDVIELKRLITDLKRRSAANLSGPENRQPAAQVQAATVYGNLRILLNEAEAQVASLQARVNDYETRVSELTEKIDSIPKIEAELTQLTREYNTIASQHSKLLERRESARLSTEVEKSTEGVKFRVIDPPHASNQPSAPNRLLLAAAALIVAIGSGAVAALAIDLLRPIYDDRHLLYLATGLPVLGVVTLVQNAKQRRHQRILWIPFFLLSLGLAIGTIIVGSGLPARFLA